MEDKGRQLFLKALHLRFHCKYEEARRAFEEAAQNGSGDACWYIFMTDKFEGPCYIEEEDEKSDYYLLQGTKLGHLLCTAIHHGLVVDPEWKTPFTPPSLASEIKLWEMCADKEPRTFSASEVSVIQKAAEQAVLIYDVCHLSIYFDYVVLQEGMIQSVNPCLIAHALCLFEDDDSMMVQYRKDGLYCDFDYQNVIEDNHFNLSDDTLFVVRCIVGKLLIKQNNLACLELKPYSDYISFYQSQKTRVNQIILAWMGCFRRKKLTWLSRDTATLIAKIMANPIYWTKLQDISKKKNCL